VTSTEMPRRALGRTGVSAPVLGYGTGAIGFNNVTQQEGARLVRYALDAGVTYVDTAHFYESEQIVGEGLAGRRDEAFIATKSAKRNYAAAWRDLRKSLQALRTDRIDLWMFHCVNTIADLDAVLAADGPIRVAQEARAQGAIRFIGITGHARPNVLALALERFPFDVVLVAMGALDSLVTSPERFVVPAAKRAGCGLAAMKVLGAGRLGDQVELAIWHSLELTADVAVVGMRTTAEIDRAVAAAKAARPLTADERAVLMAAALEHVRLADKVPDWIRDSEVIAARPEWEGAAFVA
jgi:uncharacterized protein